MARQYKQNTLELLNIILWNYINLLIQGFSKNFYRFQYGNVGSQVVIYKNNSMICS